jgi:uncharacterized membrane protein
MFAFEFDFMFEFEAVFVAWFTLDIALAAELANLLASVWMLFAAEFIWFAAEFIAFAALVTALLVVALALFVSLPPQAIPRAAKAMRAVSAIIFFIRAGFSCLSQRLSVLLFLPMSAAGRTVPKQKFLNIG